MEPGVAQAGALEIRLDLRATEVGICQIGLQERRLHERHATEAGHEGISTTPIMRTVFVTDDIKLENRVKESLTKESSARIRETEALLEDWAIVGSQQYVKDKLAEYREQLGMDYLIARGRIQGINEPQQIESHENLLKLI